jgi:uncharacterized OB-fold protein
VEDLIKYQENLTKAKALGYTDAACMACGNLSTPTSAACKKCIEATPEFTGAVNEFMRLTNTGSGH